MNNCVYHDLYIYIYIYICIVVCNIICLTAVSPSTKSCRCDIHYHPNREAFSKYRNLDIIICIYIYTYCITMETIIYY